MNKHTAIDATAFRNTPTALEKVASEIVGIAGRMGIKIITGGDFYHFRLDIEETNGASEIRAASYLNHKMRNCMAQNKETLIPFVEAYLQMNGGSAEYFSEDLLEDWVAEHFAKEKESMSNEYARYNKFPYVAPVWEMLKRPFAEGVSSKGITLKDGELGAMVLCPHPLTMNDEIRELLSENINYHAGVHMYENFRKVTAVYWLNGLQEEKDISLLVNPKISKSLEKNRVPIIYFEVKEGRIKYRPVVCEVLGL
ncbi:hypothetical protein WCX49_09160 [Sulfurimonas sp. HSL-1656]|uniref:hypothetical protein n=1 Tax=Thiomicrolovo subterrani TaxID=3131934 RepID=UPI0031F861B2